MYLNVCVCVVLLVEDGTVWVFWEMFIRMCLWTKEHPSSHLIPSYIFSEHPLDYKNDSETKKFTH